MPDPIEPQLDELRRKARRRLIGVVVLALAAAVLVPMLLESDPKPLGEDVSVKIPPVDDSKFASAHYAPIEYPAVAHYEILNALIEGAKKTKVRYHVGVTASSDTFYPGEERYDSFSKYVLRRFQGARKNGSAFMC